MINEVQLSADDIYSKQFKVDMKGYRPQEVDKFLDIVMHDYEVFTETLKKMSREKSELINETIALKQEIRNLREQLEALSSTEGTSDGTTTADVLKRLSNLEKIVYENEKK